MYADPRPHDTTVLVPSRLATPPYDDGLADFAPIDPALRLAGPDRPGLRASLVSWAANAFAWVAMVAGVVLFFLALGHAMTAEAADGYGVACLIAFGVAALATIAACAALAVSFTQRIRHGAFRRPGIIADAIALSSVTAFTVLSAMYPIAFVLAAW